ncbi:MAG: glycosyltransferase, partial [Acetobacteraceae bacterium]
MLKLPGAGRAPAWGYFDAAWYRRRYPEVTAVLVEPTDEALLGFYLSRGQRLGHAPNLWFSETQYRKRYAGVTEAIAKGALASGFDHYCRGNALTRRPHWLFDEGYYRKRNPDLTDEILEKNEVANGYSHYLASGNKEGRIGHPLFDPQVYVAAFPPDAAEEILAEGPFRHYLRRIDRREPEVRTSIYFDPAWYLARYPAVAEAIAAGEWQCALEHYLCNDTPTQFDPLPYFSEASYLTRDSNLVTAIEKRNFHNGYDHFLRFGVHEGRSPCPAIDLRWYAAQGPVQAALERNEVPDAFTHWLTIGATRGMPSRPPAATKAADAPSVEQVTRRRVQNLLPLFGRRTLDFTCADSPDLSVIMLLRDAFATTMATLAALRDNHPGAIDLILVDRGSIDECRFIERYVTGAQRLRFDSPIAVPAARNAALQYARASAVLFIGHDAVPAHGGIDAALQRLRSDPAIAAVCGMMIGGNGLIASAGGIVWRDGSMQDYARDALPIAPEANFVRDVAFGSSRFLLADTACLTALEGFDIDLGDSSAADADLCLRLAADGRRVVYDPAVVVQLTDDAATQPADAGHRGALADRHRSDLQHRPASHETSVTAARQVDTGQRRLLFIEDMVPLRAFGSGFVRTNDLIRTMADLGYAVTVFPLKGCPAEVSHVYADMPDTVEVMYDRTLGQLPDF